jgi:hypothetical protein
MIDSKSTSSVGDSPDLLVDGLPSYDSATSFPLSLTPQPGGSGAGSSSSGAGAALTAQQAYLFAGPPNAEPLKVPSTRGDRLVCNRQTDATRYTNDVWTTRVTKVESYDPAASDRQWNYESGCGYKLIRQPRSSMISWLTSRGRYPNYNCELQVRRSTHYTVAEGFMLIK